MAIVTFRTISREEKAYFDSCSQLVHVDAQIDDLEEERKQYMRKLETVERKLNEAKAKKVGLKAKTKRLDTARLRKAAYVSSAKKTPRKASGEQLSKEEVRKELTFEDNDDDEEKMIAACKSVEGQLGSVEEAVDESMKDDEGNKNLFPEGKGDDAKTEEELLESL